MRLREDASLIRVETAPVWLQVLLWLGAGGLASIAATYLALAVGLIPIDALGSGADVTALRGSASVIAAVAGALAIAHAVAAFGLATRRRWARMFTTVVCGLWLLTCIGLPVGLLAIGALWRSRSVAGPLGPSASKPVR